MNSHDKTPYTPGGLAKLLAAWYLGLVVVVFLVLSLSPEFTQYMPVGGKDALEYSKSDTLQTASPSLPQIDFGESSGLSDRVGSAGTIIALVAVHMLGTLLLMLPVAWTYRAINYEIGYPKNFLRSLILIPICATTVVLLIQNNLALAFGLAALVAAVRFSVRLDEAMDGIYVFAAVAIGLSSGVGYLGIALIMSLAFCTASLVMWMRDFGSNPVDEARAKRKLDKLSARPSEPGESEEQSTQ